MRCGWPWPTSIGARHAGWNWSVSTRDELDDLVSATGSVADGPESEQVAETLRAQTAGNPLYASQLIRHWTETGFDRDTVPPSLRDVVWSRVNAIGEDATEVLTAASVLGVDFYEDVLLDMVGLPEPVVIDTLDAAARSGLLIDAGSVRRSLRFVHALVANALYADVGPLSTRPLTRARGTRVGEERRRVAAERGRRTRAPLRARRVAGRSPALVDSRRRSRARSPRTHRGGASLPRRARHRDRARSTRRRAGRPAWCASETRSTASGDTQALDTLEEGARLAQRSGAHEALVRAAFAADRGFMRLDNGAPEYLATVEAALAVTDPADVATYARLPRPAGAEPHVHT